MNINKYTGLPYDFRSRNCWHHVCNVRSDAGLYTPPFDVSSPAAANAMFEFSQTTDSKGLVRVDTPQNFDAVLMATRHAGRLVWHSGVYYEGFISHCERAAKQVKLEALTDISKRYTEIEFWR